MSKNSQNQYTNDFDEDFEDDEDDLDFEPRQKPQGSDLLKQLRKQLRQAQKREQEREAELQTLRNERRTQTVSQILEAEGVSPKIAKFIPAEITDKDAVTAWLDENEDVFGIKRDTHQGTPNPDEDVFRRMNNATDNALSPSQIDDIYSQIDAAQSPEEVYALMDRLG
jgi:hypothetical protein